MSMYYNTVLPDDPEKIKTEIAHDLRNAIHMSRLVALRSTRKYPNRKQCIAEVQLRQLLGSIQYLADLLAEEAKEK